MGALINICYGNNAYKSAKCKGCDCKLVFGSKILSTVRTQGKFNSVSNFCCECAEKELSLHMEEIMFLVQRIIDVQEALDNEKYINKQAEISVTP